MKNLIQADIDQLDLLPVRKSFYPTDKKAIVRREEHVYVSVDWRRIRRWLISRIGTGWSQIVSDFVRLEWVPKQYRNYREIIKHVETLVYLGEDNEFWFYPEFDKPVGRPLKGESGEVFYVNPCNNLLCFKAKERRRNYKKEHQQKLARTIRILSDYHQLLKLFGIWYEVKGRPFMKGCKPTEPMIKEREYGPESSYGCEISSKRQLNKSELKQYGLTNSKI